MSARRQIDKRVHALLEIREIMNAMKNLALLESRKVSKSLAAQRETRRHLESVGSRFLQTHPQPLTPMTAANIIVVLGAERGFCGDYNKSLIAELENQLRDQSQAASVILVGRRLAVSARVDIGDAVPIDGATVGEEISDTLGRIADALSSRFAQLAPAQVLVIRHTSEVGAPIVEPLLAHFESTAPADRATGVSAELTLSPGEFFAGFVEAYLLARLREMLGTALAVENLYRVQHLNGAIRHLDQRAEELAQRSRMLRQEETIEEIEVLLLGADLSMVQPVLKTQAANKRR